MGAHRVPDLTVRDMLSRKPYPKSVWATMILLGIDIAGVITLIIVWVLMLV